MHLVVDVIIAIIIVFYFISGLKRGLIRQVFDIVGIVAAFIGAFFFAGHLAVYVDKTFNLPYQASLLIAAVVIFVGILLLFNLLGISFQKVAQVSLLKPLDRLGGGIFGAFKGILLVSLLLVIFLNIPIPKEYKTELMADPIVSSIYPVLPRVFDLILSRAPIYLEYWSGTAKRIQKATDRSGDAEERPGRELRGASW
jgi:membrane protein required for colicin V production